jgi:hypothetical protein
MEEIEKSFEELENLMDKYDLYQKDDEVGMALKELRLVITLELVNQMKNK